MLPGKRAAVLAAVIAYIRSRASRRAAQAVRRPVSAWRLSRALDIDDPASAEVEA
jgi:hypothetical protein